MIISQFKTSNHGHSHRRSCRTESRMIVKHYIIAQDICTYDVLFALVRVEDAVVGVVLLPNPEKEGTLILKARE